MFMRVNAKCAHQVRPPLAASAMCREGRPEARRQVHVCRRPGSTRQHIQCGRKRLQRSRLKPVVRQCGRFMRQPSGPYTL
jgi:hypothetical protein